MLTNKLSATEWHAYHLLGTLNFGFVQPRLALITDNSSVWDISFDKNYATMRMKLLIQLPKYQKYHIFSTRSNVLNLVRDNIGTNIIQYHKTFNQYGHIQIPKSSITFKMFENSFSDEAARFLHLILKESPMP